MSKIPCGGFELGDSLVVNDGKLDLAPGAGGGLPTGEAPYQQLVTDGDGNAKWEDRLCYETEPVLTEIVPEETVAFSEMTGLMAALWPSTFNPVYGSIYTVKIDGNAYNCACIRLGDGDGVPVLGNLSLAELGEDTGEPFLMLYQRPWVFVSADSASEHTLSIFQEQTSISKIDKKYLPESAFTDAIWECIENRPIDGPEVVDYELQEEVTLRSIGGSNYANTSIAIDFTPGYGYQVDGTIKFLSLASRVTTTLNVNGFYVADFVGSLNLGDFYDNYWRKFARIDLYGAEAKGYPRKLSFSSAIKDTWTITINLKFSQKVKCLDEKFIPSTIQRNGKDLKIKNQSGDQLSIIIDNNGVAQVAEPNSGYEFSTTIPCVDIKDNGQRLCVVDGQWVPSFDLILPSSSEGSAKKFKITVDDSGVISATEVTT